MRSLAFHAQEPIELLELRPVAVILEGLAVGATPRFDRAALTELQAANRRLRAARGAGDAAAADDAFHELLTAGCERPDLLALLRATRRRLADGRRRRPAGAAVEQMAARHDAIIRALACGDRDAAVERTRRSALDCAR